MSKAYNTLIQAVTEMLDSTARIADHQNVQNVYTEPVLGLELLLHNLDKINIVNVRNLSASNPNNTISQIKSLDPKNINIGLPNNSDLRIVLKHMTEIDLTILRYAENTEALLKAEKMSIVRFKDSNVIANSIKNEVLLLPAVGSRYNFTESLSNYMSRLSKSNAIDLQRDSIIAVYIKEYNLLLIGADTLRIESDQLLINNVSRNGNTYTMHPLATIMLTYSNVLAILWGTHPKNELNIPDFTKITTEPFTALENFRADVKNKAITGQIKRAKEERVEVLKSELRDLATQKNEYTQHLNRIETNIVRKNRQLERLFDTKESQDVLVANLFQSLLRIVNIETVELFNSKNVPSDVLRYGSLNIHDDKWYLILKTKPIEYTKFVPEELERYSGLNSSFNNALKRVAKREYHLFFGEFYLVYELTEDLILTVDQNANVQQTITPITAYNNPHNAIGCLGNYKNPRQELIANNRIVDLVYLDLEFLQSLTLGDGGMNSVVSRCYIIDENNKIAYDGARMERFVSESNRVTFDPELLASYVRRKFKYKPANLKEFAKTILEITETKGEKANEKPQENQTVEETQKLQNTEEHTADNSRRELTAEERAAIRREIENARNNITGTA